MSNLETNKRAVQSWFDAVNAGDEAAILALTTEDFLFKTMARSPAWLQYEWDRNAFAAVPSTMSTLLTAPIHMKVLSIIGEGDIVAAEAETDAEMLNGRRYNNAYHLAFTMRDGKFAEVREYSCSHLAQSCFGAVEPGHPEKSAMAG
jgi:ketosteroid isomerase-like protein